MTSLPADISLEFAPTPQTLWAVWGEAPDYQVETGWSEPVYQVWVLASPGEAGMAEIKSQLTDEFLAAVPLEQIANAKSMLDETGSGRIAELWPKWLPSIGAASFFLRNDGAKSTWAFGSNEKNINSNEAAVEGRVSDFIAMHAEGVRILSTLDYKAILGDGRPVAPGHPLDWLAVMKCPEHVIPMRNLFSGHDE